LKKALRRAHLLYLVLCFLAPVRKARKEKVSSEVILSILLLPNSFLN